MMMLEECYVSLYREIFGSFNISNELYADLKSSIIHFAETGDSVLTIKGPQGRINRAVWGPLNTTIISAGEDAVVRIWDSEVHGCTNLMVALLYSKNRLVVLWLQLAFHYLQLYGIIWVLVGFLPKRNLSFSLLLLLFSYSILDSILL
jgi:WD40 repeat protein